MSDYISVAAVLDRFNEYLKDKNFASGTIRNCLSTVKKFIEFHSLCDPAGVKTIIDKYDKLEESYISSLSKNKNVKKNRLRVERSNLSKFHGVVLEYVELENLPKSLPHAISYIFKQRGLKFKRVAREVFGDETKCRNLMNWAQGVNMPTENSVYMIEKLEKYLLLPRNTFLKMLPTYYSTKKLDWHRTAYGEKMAEITRNNVRTSFTDWSGELEEEYQIIYAIKIESRYTSSSGSSIKNRGKWTLDEDGHCATAASFRQFSSQFFGFIINHRIRYGITEDQLSFSLYASSELVNGWIKFIKSRNGGINNGYVEKVLINAKMLLNPRTGILHNINQKKLEYFGDLGKNKWQKICKKSYKNLNEYHSDIKDDGGFVKTRDPKETLARILDRDHPIDTIREIISEHEKARPGSHQSATKYATWYFSLLLLNLELVCPLRMKSLAYLTYYDSQQGSIYKSENGIWWLYLKSKTFKNHLGAAKEDYKLSLPKKVGDLIDEWVDVHRPILLETYNEKYLKKNKNRFFVFNANMGVYKKNGPPTHLRDIAKSLSARISYMFKKYLRISAGGHSFRHIVATDYLRHNPNSFSTVAAILHDKIETVIRDYSHLRIDDSLRRYHMYLESF